MARESILADVTSVQHLGVQRLLATALWPIGRPEWAADAWHALKERLPNNADWDVWTVWYENLTIGAPVDTSFDLACLMIPEAVWEEGASAANKWIWEHAYGSRGSVMQSERGPPVSTQQRAVTSIVDADAFRGWLNRQPREVFVLIAVRAALRILPLASRYQTLADDPRDVGLDLQISSALYFVRPQSLVRSQNFPSAPSGTAGRGCERGRSRLGGSRTLCVCIILACGRSSGLRPRRCSGSS